MPWYLWLFLNVLTLGWKILIAQCYWLLLCGFFHLHLISGITSPIYILLLVWLLQLRTSLESVWILATNFNTEQYLSGIHDRCLSDYLGKCMRFNHTSRTTKNIVYRRNISTSELNKLRTTLSKIMTGIILKAIIHAHKLGMKNLLM